MKLKLPSFWTIKLNEDIASFMHGSLIGLLLGLLVGLVVLRNF